MYCTKTWNITISVVSIASESIKYFCYLNGHRSAFYFMHDDDCVTVVGSFWYRPGDSEKSYVVLSLDPYRLQLQNVVLKWVKA